MDSKELRELSQQGAALGITLSGAALIALAKLMDAAKRQGVRGADNVEYWAETCIVNGATAQERAWRYQNETRDRKAYEQEIESLKLNPIRMTPAETVLFCTISLKYGQNNITADDVALAKERLAESQKEKE